MKMNKTIGPALWIVIVLVGCRAMLGMQTFRLYDLGNAGELVGQEALERLRPANIILVGEHHADAGHHVAQIEVVRALDQAGEKLVIGLEMFRQEGQADLDHWVSGELGEAQFKTIYLDNWNFDWALYRPIFLYARQRRIPMVGLNVDPGVTRQVAYHGFNSLSDDKKALLGPLVCDVTPEYRAYIREAFDDHAHGGMNFDHFCQAQLVWDTAMAVNATAYLQQHPDTTMILLAGSGHAQKKGIPTQLAKRAPWQVVVILPETPGVFEKNNVTVADADLLMPAQ